MSILKNGGIFLLACMAFAACSAGNVSVDNSVNNSNSGLPSVTAVPTEVQGLINNVCQRPTPFRVSGNFNGKVFNYTEVISEQDEGNVLASASSLLAKDLVGVMHIEPSPDDKIYWAARKWAMAETKQKADAAMKNIKIESRILTTTSRVVVDHPLNNFPPERYMVCLVAKVPAALITDLVNDSGPITSIDHQAALSADTDSGSIDVIQKGSGNLILSTGSGSITVRTDEAGGAINVNADSGSIDVVQKGLGFVKAFTGSGLINVSADSRGGVDLDTGSGSISYVLKNGGIALQNNSSLSTVSGSIGLTFEDDFSFQLDAQTEVGFINASSELESFIEDVDTTSQRLLVDINGGGKVLRIRPQTGGISITAQ